MVLFLVGKEHRKSIERILIKIGTNILIDDRFNLREDNLKRIVSQVSTLVSRGIKVILVSSGAIGLGVSRLGLGAVPKDDSLRRLCAGVGQAGLTQRYDIEFSRYDLKTCQLLLTVNELDNRAQFLKTRSMINTAIDKGVVIIINENDTVTHEHNSFGNNDTLAMHVASKVDASLAVFLTNVNGVYTKDPEMGGELIDVVDNGLDLNISRSKSRLGSGGMYEKVSSARNCSRLGIPVIVANGNSDGIIDQIISGRFTGTMFKEESRQNSKKRWIYVTKSKGNVDVDEGAFIALNTKNSLLAAGISLVEGDFKRKDVITISYNDNVIAKAIAELASEEVVDVMGKSSKVIKGMEGYEDYRQVCARENMVFTISK